MCPADRDRGQVLVEVEPDVLRALHYPQHVGVLQPFGRSLGEAVPVRVRLQLVDPQRTARRLHGHEQPLVAGRDPQVHGLVGVLQPLAGLRRLLRRQLEFPDPLLGSGEFPPGQVLPDRVVEFLVPLGVGGEEHEHVPVQPVRGPASLRRPMDAK